MKKIFALIGFFILWLIIMLIWINLTSCAPAHHRHANRKRYKGYPYFGPPLTEKQSRHVKF